MTVTQVLPLTKMKYKVFLDGQFAFALYKGELSRYNIAEGQDISKSITEEILKVVLQRAKRRALHLLNDMDRTESQLFEKLVYGNYPEDIANQAIAYVKSFGYIDDVGYARRFVECRKAKKSKKEIYVLLCRKGLERELIERTLDECYESEDSKYAILDIMRKKRYNPDTATEKETQKIYACLARKGFRYEDICQVIQVSEWNA